MVPVICVTQWVASRSCPSPTNEQAIRLNLGLVTYVYQWFMIFRSTNSIFEMKCTAMAKFKLAATSHLFLGVPIVIYSGDSDIHHSKEVSYWTRDSILARVRFE